jgi:hypothetical protein
MDTGGGTYAEELVFVLAAATAALRDLPDLVHRLTGPELDTVLPAVDRLAAAAAAGRFTITGEAVHRGEVAASHAGSVPQWVSDRCPSLDAREAGVVARAVRELDVAILSDARSAVAQGLLSLSAGCVVAAEWRQLAHWSNPAPPKR